MLNVIFFPCFLPKKCYTEKLQNYVKIVFLLWALGIPFFRDFLNILVDLENFESSNMFPQVHRFLYKMEDLSTYPLMSLNSELYKMEDLSDVIEPVSSKKWNFVFLEKTQLVSKELEIKILR